MTAETKAAAARFLSGNKTLLLVLALGLALLLLPDLSGGAAGETGRETLTEEEQRLRGALSRMVGVGETYVLLAEGEGSRGGCTGAVVVCAGAEDPAVRLRIVNAVSAFTGLGSDKIIVLKMKS